MFTHLIITEDQEVLGISREPTAEEKADVDDGVIAIIRISDCTEYYADKWVSIKEYKTE